MKLFLFLFLSLQHIVEGLAQRMINGEVPETLKYKNCYRWIWRHCSRGKYRCEFEETLKSVLKEIAQSKGSVIVFIDELHP